MCVGVSIARTGEMLYAKDETPLEPGPDGKVVVSRDEKEVFRPETIASFEGKAITIAHPQDFVSPDNWGSLAKGILQNVRRGEGEQVQDLVADLLITDSVAINLVKNGLREVSCGYEAEYTQTGEGRGVQSAIIGNHLALVAQGRAGSSYAINDHNGKGSLMKLKDKIKAILARAQDEALKVADEMPPEEPKEEKATDAYGDIMNMVKDLGSKLEALKAKDTTPPTQSSAAEITAKDDTQVAPGLEERLKKLEDMVSNLMAREAKEEEVPVGDAEEKGEEGEEKAEDAGCKDEEGEEEMVGDTADSVSPDTVSRVEILAPGMDYTQKDAKAKALKAAYATKDGKAVIDQFTGGKAPDLKTPAIVDALFVGASEVLKAARTSQLSETKQTRDSHLLTGPKGPMTAEQMNEINAKHFAKKNGFN